MTEAMVRICALPKLVWICRQLFDTRHLPSSLFRGSRELLVIPALELSVQLRVRAYPVWPYVRAGPSVSTVKEGETMSCDYDCTEQTKVIIILVIRLLIYSTIALNTGCTIQSHSLCHRWLCHFQTVTITTSIHFVFMLFCFKERIEC